MALKEEKISRRGGRSARRAARTNAPIVHHPPLIPNVPVYEVANTEGEEQIHELAMRIVEEIGVEFRDEESLDIWRRTDAEIEGERVRVGRGTLMDLVAKAPSEYVHHARNRERTVTVGGSSMVVSPSYGPPFILDFDRVRRHARLDDLHNLQKLNHMASSVHIAGGPIVEPVDVPVPYRHMHMAYSGWKYSDKPIMGNVTARERAEDTIDMCKIVFGDEFATNNCCTTSLLNSNSPLIWDATMLDALKVYASNNHAVMCSPFSMAAASTPAEQCRHHGRGDGGGPDGDRVRPACAPGRACAVRRASHDGRAQYRRAGPWQSGFRDRAVPRRPDGPALRRAPSCDYKLRHVQDARPAGGL